MENRQLLSLQVLRAVAALAVVIHHAIRAVVVNNGDVAFGSPLFIDNHAIMEIGAAGVDIFLFSVALSWFILQLEAVASRAKLEVFCLIDLSGSGRYML